MSKLNSKLFNEFTCFVDNPTNTNLGDGGGGSEDLRPDTILDFLNAEDKKEPEEVKEVIELEPVRRPKRDEKVEEEPKKETKKEGEEEEPDELSALEEELNPPTEEQLELVTPVRRRDILKKYPELFKDFPYLEKAYYREQQFTEIHPTIEDARESKEKAETLDRFETDLVSNGNTITILKTVKEENPASFAKIVDNYLTDLQKVDEPAFQHVASNLIKHTIISMAREAKNSNNEQLGVAAQILNQFMFGSSEFIPPQKMSKSEDNKDSEKEKQLTEREQKILERDFNSALTDLNTRVNNTLRNTIDAHIDPKNSMTEYVKKNASRDALNMLSEAIGRDTRFKALADKLWEAAIKAGFTQESKDRIKSAYVARAKTLLPTVITKARNDALRGMGKRTESNEDPDNRGPVTPGRPRSQNPNSGKVSKASEIPKGMSTLDFLSQD